MKPAQRLFLLLIIAGLAGCALIDKQMESWMGHHQSDLIASWGPPQQVMDDGQGGKIFVYTYTRSRTSPATAKTEYSGRAHSYGNGLSTRLKGTSTTTFTPATTTTYTKRRMFWIDSNARIYRWAWKGL